MIRKRDIFLHMLTEQLNSRDGDHEVGKISKKFGGIISEMFTTADTFGVSCKLVFCLHY